MKWEKVKLENACIIIAGQSPESQYYNQNRIGIPFFQGKADFTDRFPVIRNWCNKPTKIAIENDILLSVRAPVGPTNICNVESCIGRGLASIRAKDNTHFLYVYFFFKHIEERLKNSGTGSTFTAITIGDVKNIEIPLPPLSVQKAIADKLDKADALRKKDQQLLKHYDDLAQSVFIEMFGDPVKNEKGWEEKNLEDLCEITSSKRIFQDEYVEYGIPFYRTKEIVNLSNGDEIKTELFISEFRFNEIKNNFAIPKKGDILISAVGTIGVMWIVDDRTFYFKDGNLIWMKNLRFNNVFLKFFIENKLKTLKYKMAEGAAYTALTIEKIKKFKICIPQNELVEKFASIIENIELQKQKVKLQAQESENLFQALLQEVFGG